MASARPVFQLELRASDHYLVLLGGALLGYAVLGKYFAYLGIPPLFVGEIALLTGFAVALRTGCLVAALAALPNLLLAIAMIWVMLRTLPYLGEHGFNALVCDWDDLRGTARLLDLLARDRRLLHRLRTNARLTARAWPTWEQSGEFMAAALRAIHRAPPPSPQRAALAALADVRAGVEAHRVYLAERDEYARKVERIERITKQPAVARLLAQRQRRGLRRLLSLGKRLLSR